MQRSLSASLSRRNLLSAAAVLALGTAATLLFKPAAALAVQVEVFKDPSCECCERWARHLRKNGFNVVVNDVEDISTVKAMAGIPDYLSSCHTAFIDGYLVEGHVPARDIRRMLETRPAIKGIAVPGMPQSAPGMDSPDYEPFQVFSFDDKDATDIFASY